MADGDSVILGQENDAASETELHRPAQTLGTQPHADGVYGQGGSGGYGGQFEGGFAPLRLVPQSADTGRIGHPTTSPHSAGEFYVDTQGSLFYCKVTGTPGTWVQLA